MNNFANIRWFAAGGAIARPEDTMETKSKQRIVKDEVSFDSGIDPIKSIIAASKNVLVAMDAPRTSGSNNGSEDVKNARFVSEK